MMWEKHTHGHGREHQSKSGCGREHETKQVDSKQHRSDHHRGQREST